MARTEIRLNGSVHRCSVSKIFIISYLFHYNTSVCDSAHIVAEWHPCDDNVIEVENPVIYDHWDPEIRTRLERGELRTWNLTDELGEEICIYNEDGFCIPRCSVTSQVSGLLVDLTNLDDLYSGTPGNHLFIDDNGKISQGRHNVYSIYPQACLHNLGHFQAHALPHVFHPYLKCLNEVVGYKHQINNPFRPPNDELSSDDDGDDEKLFEIMTPITSTAVQFYNLTMHHACRTKRDHDVQRGLVTAALGGHYVAAATEKTALNKIHRNLRYGLPHQQFNSKISSPAVSHSL